MPYETSDWEYSDWRTKPTPSEQLTAARFHDAEVRRAALEVGSGQGRYSRLPQNYLTELGVDIRRLENVVSGAKPAGQVSGRGVPVRLKPSF